jgi:hypothetical protein
MSDRDRRIHKDGAKRRQPLFDHLEDVDAPLNLRPGPPSPLRDLVGDIDDDIPLRSEPRRAAPPQSAPAQRAPQPRAAAPQQAPAPRAAAPAQQPRKAAPVQPATETATRPRPVMRPAAPSHDDDDDLRVAHHALDEAEAQLRFAEQPSARPYVRYAPSPEPPSFSFGNPIAVFMVAIVSMLVIATFSGGGASQFSAWFPGGSAAQQSREGLFSALTASRPVGDYNLVSAPSITAEQIDRILTSYGSPAAGTGQVWYSLGQQYGIDPAFAVAFFIMESSAGTAPGWAGFKPDGSVTHNVGNIICAGYQRCHNRFRDYGSWEEGISDWYRLIDVEYIKGRGTTTLQQIIPIYAPSFENDVDGYINTVGRLVDGWRTAGVP